jgi:hypothetical protein
MFVCQSSLAQISTTGTFYFGRLGISHIAPTFRHSQQPCGYAADIMVDSRESGDPHYSRVTNHDGQQGFTLAQGQ